MKEKYKQTAANTISALNAFDFFDRKYYGVLLDDNPDETWTILFNRVIDKSKFFEYEIGPDYSHSSFDRIKEIAPSFPATRENNRILTLKEEFERLKEVGLQNNIVHFYSTKKDKFRQNPYDTYIARLKIDENLKTILKSIEFLMHYEDELEINGIEFEFFDGAFYEDETTVLLFSDHIDFKSYILLSEEEKEELEEQGVQFSDAKERVPITIPEGIVSFEEIMKL